MVDVMVMDKVSDVFAVGIQSPELSAVLPAMFGWGFCTRVICECHS